MRAAQIVDYGDSTVIQINENVPRPEPAVGQVLVAVHAASVNPFDNKLRSGVMQSMFPLQFPATLGGDVSGTVVAIGERVSGFDIGQKVYGQANAISGQGSFAEFVCVKAESLASMPNNSDYISATALPLVAISAYQAIVDHMQLQAGQKILIHGASGGIGSMAVQLAKHCGAYVIATTSADGFELAKQLGADEVIDYRATDFAADLADLDAVFDTVGGETNSKSYDVLRNGGALVSMVEAVDEARANAKGLHYTQQFTRVTTDRLTKIAELYDEGILHVKVDKTFDLSEAAAAMEYLESGHPHGKVVLKVTD